MSLDERVAIALGCTFKIQGNGKIWYATNGEYIGVELPSWSTDTGEAFALLRDKHWKIWTCDDGYGCEIYRARRQYVHILHILKAPEKGEELLSKAFGPNLSHVICQAFIELSGKTGIVDRV